MRAISDKELNGSQDEQSSTSMFLVRELQEGQDDGWEQLVGIYGPAVYRRCRKAGLRVEDAEDIAQNVFSSVARSIGSFRRQVGASSFRKWLSVITTNKLRDYWRKHLDLEKGLGGTSWHCWLQSVEEEMDGSFDDLDSGSGEDSRLELIYEVRAECSARDWAIFERVALGESTAREVAEEFSVSENVVYLVRSRLLRKLRSTPKTEAG